MFFWNKYCGTVFLFLGLNTSLLAQNLETYQLIERRFLSKNISLTRESNDNNFLGSSSLFIQRDDSLQDKPLSSVSFSRANDTIICKKTGLPINGILDNLAAFNPLSFASEKPLTKILPPDFSTCHYGFFCKQEMKIEKATNLPIRLRLGSLQQCNYYEGKP